jgi:hypothetical protein
MTTAGKRQTRSLSSSKAHLDGNSRALPECDLRQPPLPPPAKAAPARGGKSAPKSSGAMATAAGYSTTAAPSKQPKHITLSASPKRAANAAPTPSTRATASPCAPIAIASRHVARPQPAAHAGSGDPNTIPDSSDGVDADSAKTNRAARRRPSTDHRPVDHAGAAPLDVTRRTIRPSAQVSAPRGWPGPPSHPTIRHRNALWRAVRARTDARSRYGKTARLGAA